MDNDEVIQLLSKIDKKLDKTLNLLTKVSKALHLLPVTEKEERALQIQQRENLAMSAKVNEQLNAMENKEDAVGALSIETLNLGEGKTIYADVVGDEFLE